MVARASESRLYGAAQGVPRMNPLHQYHAVRNATLAGRFGVWRTVLRDLRKTVWPDRTVVRFPNSSSYIFSTGDTFWAVDLMYSLPPCPAEEVEAVADGVRDFAFIILTHCHGDHLQLPLLQRIGRNGRTKLVISSAIARQFKACAGEPFEEMIVLEPGTSVCLDNITLTCYPGYHDEPGTAGWPAGAFLATLPDGLTLYLPGDVRDYSLPLPEGLPPVDFEFGHVWLGRGNALEAEFPMAEACCRFLLQARPGAIFLTHLREVSRDPDSMWLPRHAALLQAHIAEMAPETVVTIPAPGDVVTLSRPFTPDRFAEWPVAEQREFLDNLGVAIRLEVWCPVLETAIRERVPVLELAGSLPAADDLPALSEALADWRASGGRVLSAHLADILPDPGRAARYQAACRQFIALGIDRVTQHVPNCTVAEYAADPEHIVELFAKALEPLIGAGVAIGIENMHMGARTPTGSQRPYGFTPEECRDFVEALRRHTGYDGIGLHFDIGHASSNYPLTEPYPAEFWLAHGGDLINGVHLHQCAAPPARVGDYPEGHHHVTGRTGGYPDLRPFYAAWKARAFRAPIFLEVRRGPEQDSFPSLARLRAGAGKFGSSEVWEF